MDKCYRYLLSDRNGEPLSQIDAKGVNMEDVRSCLKAKGVKCKIWKRVLQRIGHVVPMGKERLTKTRVFGGKRQQEGVETFCTGK